MPLPPATQLTGGGAFTCAAIANGSADEVWCWGSNSSRQLGTDAGRGDDPKSTYAVRVDRSAFQQTPPQRVVSLSAGEAHACVGYVPALVFGDSAARVKTACWGANKERQIGRSDADKDTAPPGPFPEPMPRLCLNDQTGALRNFMAVNHSIRSAAPGFEHTCAILTLPTPTASELTSFSNTCREIDFTKSYVVCAGDDDVGKLGTGGIGGGGEEHGPLLLTRAEGAPVTGFEQLIAGDQFTCGRDGASGASGEGGEGVVSCWGSNAHSELAQTGAQLEARYSATPLEVSVRDAGGAQLLVKDMAAGPEHVCVIGHTSAQGPTYPRVFCWGAPARGASGPIPACGQAPADSEVCGYLVRELALP